MSHDLSPEAMFMVVTVVGVGAGIALTHLSTWRPAPRHRAARTTPVPAEVVARACFGHCGVLVLVDQSRCPHGDVVCVDCDPRDVCGDCYMEGRAADGAARWTGANR